LRELNLKDTRGSSMFSEGCKIMLALFNITKPLF
jgi:hypothetical protein